MRMRQILWRELVQCRMDYRRFIFLFGAALAYLLIFGVLYSPNIVKHIPCVICDEEGSQLSRSLVRGFEDSDSFQVTEYADTPEAMREALHEKRVYAAVDIPQDFSKRIKTGDASTVLFMVNGSNIILTNITTSAAQDILADFSDKLAVRNAALRFGVNEQLLTHRISPVSCHLRVLNNPKQGYTLFFLLGLAMVAFQQGIIFSAGASLQYEYAIKEERDPQAEEPAAVHRKSCWQLLLGKLVFYWVLSMLSFVMVAYTAVYLWDIPFRAQAGQLLLLGGVFCFTAIAFSFFAASLFHNEMQFVRAAIMYPVPAFIFSGYTWPQEAMGPAMQLISKFFPLSWFSNTVRELFLSGMASQYGTCLAVLALMGVVCLAVSGAVFRSRMRCV